MFTPDQLSSTSQFYAFKAMQFELAHGTAQAQAQQLAQKLEEASAALAEASAFKEKVLSACKKAGMTIEELLANIE